MNSRPSRWIILPVMLFAGCGEDVAVLPKVSTARSGELTPVEFDTLEFIHDTLADRIRRIDTLARRVGLPRENTIEWSRRPPNANDGRKLQSYVAQWSTHRMGPGDAIQPDQRPGQKICVIADVNPADNKTLSGFHLQADWKSRDEGWNASLSMFSFRPYQRDSVGQEKLRIWLEPTDRTTRVGWPFSDWGAEVTIERRDAQQGNSLVTIHTVPQVPNLEQSAELFASPVSFLKGMRRELDETERRVLDDIAASRNIRLSRYEQVRSRASRPIPSMGFRDVEIPPGFQLTAGEKQALTAKLTEWIQNRRKLFEENHEEMYSAITQTFPLDEYFAAESDARTSVVDPRN